MSCPDCPDTTATSDALAAAIAGPASVSGDAGSVTSHNLRDLIEADRYQRAKCVSSSPRRGLRFTKLNQPGSL